MIQTQAQNDRYFELMRYLRDTDYIGIKIAEGSATKEDYATELSQRAAARVEINQLLGA